MGNTCFFFLIFFALTILTFNGACLLALKNWSSCLPELPWLGHPTMSMNIEHREFLLTSFQSSQEFSICLWDYEAKNCIRIYKNGDTVPPKTLAMIGQDYILSAEANKPLLHVRQSNSREIDESLRLILPGPATCLSICPENMYLAVAVETKLFIWQLGTGKLLSVQQRHCQPITTIRFSSNSQYVAVAGEDGVLVVYYLADLVGTNHSTPSNAGQVEPVYQKKDHTKPITDIDIGTFGQNSRLATCSLDFTVRIYVLNTGYLLRNLVFNELLTTIMFDSPFCELFIGMNSGLVRRFTTRGPPSVTKYYVRKSRGNEFVGHKKKIVALATNFNCSLLATGSEDNFVFIWDTATRLIMQKYNHKSQITNVMFVPNYHNFLKQHFKPTIVLKALERINNQEAQDSTVSLVHAEHVQSSEEQTTDVA